MRCSLASSRATARRSTDCICARPSERPATRRALDTNCTDGASALRADSSTSEAAKSAVGAWLDAEKALAASANPLEQYLSADDWKEDGFRGVDALWSGVKAALDRRDAALGAVQRDVLPLLRDEIRAKGAAHERKKARDGVVWRVAVGLVQWEVEEAAARSMEEPANAGALASPRSSAVVTVHVTDGRERPIRSDGASAAQRRSTLSDGPTLPRPFTGEGRERK